MTRERCCALTLVTLVLLLHTSPSHADVGATSSPADVWTQWSWDPVVLSAVAISGWAYGLGVLRLWRAAGRHRVIGRWRFASFYMGLGLLTIALVSPLDALGATLFSAHMVQHLVLVALAAPLAVLGKPLVAVAWAVPSARRSMIREALHALPLRWAVAALRRPIVAVALHAVALWIWHMPALYEAALANEVVHWLEHASFFGTSVLLWGVLLGPACSPGLRVVYLFVTASQAVVLGALLTMAPTPWYTMHEAGARAWGLKLIEDQQIAGLIMWVPGGVVYLVAALSAFASWLVLAERAVKRRERMGGRAWRMQADAVSRYSREQKGENVETQSNRSVCVGPGRERL
jgi:putative membrane protein